MRFSSSVDIRQIFSICSIFLLQSFMTYELGDFLQDSNVTVIQGNNTCMPGYFGETCARKCPSACYKTCDYQGLCQACLRAGVQLPTCTKKCMKGFYGVHCKRRCTACRHADCDPQTGKCRNCQLSGFQLPLCTVACLPGTLGMHCKSRCPLSCREKCDAVSGECTECKHGLGPQCQVNCASEDNLGVCKLYCPDRCLTWCNTADSSCAVCAPGYKPPYCRQTCNDGYYGNNCEEICSSRCKDNRCNPVSGLCYACNDGYVGQRCNGQCVPGLYGPDCLIPCPETCADGLCNLTTGSCTRCSPGYTGARCFELCQESKYGEGCKLDCQDTCGGKCDPVTGECWQCVPGYVGVFCNETCKDGTYGQGCANVCPVGCVEHMCDHVTGKCIACKENLRGSMCDEMDASSSTHVELVIVVSLGLTILVIMLAIVVVCLKHKINKDIVAGEAGKHLNTQHKEEAVSSHETCNKYNNHVAEKSADTEAKNQKIRSVEQTAKDVQCIQLSTYSGRLHKKHLHKILHSSYHHLADIPCPHGLNSGKSFELRKHEERSSPELEESLISVMNLSSKETGMTSPTSNVRKLVRRAHEDCVFAGKRISNPVSKVAELKLPPNSYQNRDRHVFIPEGRNFSRRAENNFLTSAANRFYAQEKSSGETKITLFECAECSQGKAAVSTTLSVSLLAGTPMLLSERSPEMIITNSRDTVRSGRINSADSLFGVASPNLSIEATPTSHTKLNSFETEKKVSVKTNLSNYPTTVNTIQGLPGLNFTDTPAGCNTIMQICTELQRGPSTINTAEVSLPLLFTSLTNHKNVNTLDQNKVLIGQSATASTDYDASEGKDFSTQEMDTNNDDAMEVSLEKHEVVPVAARRSCASERLVVPSNIFFPMHPGFRIGKLRTDEFNNDVSNDTSLDSLVNTVSTAQQDKPGSPSVQKYETNNRLKFGDLQTIADSSHRSSILATTDSPQTSEEMFHVVVRQEESSSARKQMAISSGHHSPKLSGLISSPKRRAKSEVLLGEDTQNENHKVSMHKEHTQCQLVEEKGTSKAIQIPSTPPVSSSQGVTPRWTNRGAGIGENPSPKLIRCSTTRQVSPMYSHNNVPQATTRLRPLPTPPPEGIKALRSVKKSSMSSSPSTEFPVADADTEK